MEVTVPSKQIKTQVFFAQIFDMAMHIIIQWQKNEERRENTTTRGNMRPRRGKEARRERRIHEKNPKT